MMIKGLLTAASAAALASASASASAGAAVQAKVFDIPAQPAATAIGAFGRQAGIEIIAAHSLVGEKQANRVAGDLGTEEALDRLLRGTGLGFRKVSDRAYRVVADASGSEPAPGAFREPADAPAPAVQAGPDIVVTAQKREEKLREVPVPVTALSSRQLTTQNLLRIQDYYTRIPGLGLTSNARGDEKVISIRGITTGGGNPTVGIVVDDVPYGSTSGYAGGGTVPDIDPSDLDRVEVLRGPQGTLYGASSIGGLLKFVTVDPSTSAISGRVSAGISAVRNGSSIGTNFRGAINLPITETLAVRASAFSRIDPGYIDNVRSGIDGVNRTHVAGGRFVALWKPAPDFSIKLGAIIQDNDLRGGPGVDAGAIGQLRQSDVPGTGFSNKHIEIYNGTVRARIGGIDLVSVTGYSRNRVSHNIDDSQELGEVAALFYGASGAALTERIRTSKFSEELRLSGALGPHVDWLGGAYFTNETSHLAQALNVLDADSGATILPNWLYATWPTGFREYSVFADVTVKLSDRFDIQFGGRQSWNHQTYSEIDSGPFIDQLVAPGPLINPEVTTNDDSFTYLITPRFRITPDLMVYARIATGYRAGGPNPTAAVFDLPEHFKPDKTRNYEIGLKGRTFDRRLGFDLSVYHIKWSDIQLSLHDPVSSAAFFGNATAAASDGVEAQFDLRAWRGMTLGATGSWNHARLTEAFPATAGVIGVKGARLPFTSRTSASFSADQSLPLGVHATASLGGALSIIGSRLGTFFTTPARQRLPGFTQLDLHAGVALDNGLAFNLFATNVTDRRALLSGGVGTSAPATFQIIQPRTVGATMSKTF